MGTGSKEWKKFRRARRGGGAHVVTIGNIPSLEWFQAIPNGKSRLMCVYSDDEQATWFREAWTKTGKKLVSLGQASVHLPVTNWSPSHVTYREFLGEQLSGPLLAGDGGNYWTFAKR